MFFGNNFLLNKRIYLGGLLVLLLIAVVFMGFSMKDKDDFDFARREVLLRRIGHELLLQSGDSVSRVLPVNQISKNEYEISFEKAFGFQPESLVNITQRLLARESIAKDYVVSVINCENSTVAYGYAISRNKKDDIVTCLGRKQPEGCYKINIKFKPAGVVSMRNGYLLGGFAILAIVGFLLFKSFKPRKTEPESTNSEIFNLGTISFDAGARKLVLNGEDIDLTRTEARILRIFALSPNVPIERSRLQKEIWEDEGVIVGRSLDMFISKLRKKLEVDPNIKIAVIRGKGYKLELGA